MGEDIIEFADSIHSLLSQMSVTGMWDRTRFLRKAVGYITPSAPERSVAEAILSHSHVHLAIYDQATLLKDALAKKNTSAEQEELVPLKITSRKPIGSFTCEDCHRIQTRVLSADYGILEGKIICHNADESHSTSVTFFIPSQYIQDIVQRSTHLPTAWVLLELEIIEVTIPGVFTFSPSVGCFLTLLRGSKSFTADLLGVSEVMALLIIMQFLLPFFCSLHLV